MSTKFLSGGSSQPDPPVLEAQQALLLRTLRRARGKPVGYDQLREAGIEFPASVVAELELAGIPIERCQPTGPRSAVGVRLPADGLDPELERALEPVGPPAPAQRREPAQSPAQEPRPAHRPDSAAPGPHPDWSPVRVYRTSPASALAHAGAELALAAGASVRDAARTPNRRVLAPLAVLAAVGIVIGLVLAVPGGGAAHPKAAAARRHAPSHRLVAAAHRTTRTSPATATRQAGTTATSTPSAPATTTTTSTSTPVSPTLATSLESQGHTLLESGQYAGAVPILRRALAATGESTSGCAEPTSSTCLTYAYALYDLGRALRLSGDSAAAVPILEARLQIDNQRPAVAAELQLARAQAG